MSAASSTPQSVAPAPGRPAVVLWYKVYAGFMAVLYLGCGLFSLAIMGGALEDPDEGMDRAFSKIFGGFLLALSAALLAAFALPFLLRPRPWLWIYGIVLIGIGLTSACTLPACVPLLIFWFKPETKAYFGRA